jgi:HEAT repeat protein
VRLFLLDGLVNHSATGRRYGGRNPHPFSTIVRSLIMWSRVPAMAPSTRAPFGFTVCALNVFVALFMLAPAVCAAPKADPLQDARRAFAQKQYDRTLALLDALPNDQGIGVDARRLRVRTLARVGKAGDALAEYDRLVELMKREDEPTLREIALGFITPLIHDMREQMRGAAYTALKEMDSDEAIPYLEDGVGDGSGLVRALAVEGLGKRAAGRRSPRIRKALEDQAAIVRAAAVKALGRSNEAAAIGSIQQALKDEQPLVRVTAEGMLASLHQTGAWERLRDSAGSANPESRATALRMLGETKDHRGLPMLTEALSDQQPSVRGAAAAGLGDLGSPEAISPLTGLVRDPVPAVRAAAIVALGALQARDVVPMLKAALQDVNVPVRAAALATLLQVGVPFEEAAEAVRELLQHNDPAVRSSLARALAKTNDPQAIASLELLLTDALPRPRIAAARSLGHIGGPAVIPSLKRALRDQDEAVRATAGGALLRSLGDVKRRAAHQKNAGEGSA